MIESGDQQFSRRSPYLPRTFELTKKMPHCASNHHPPYFRLISWCILWLFLSLRWFRLPRIQYCSRYYLIVLTVFFTCQGLSRVPRKSRWQCLRPRDLFRVMTLPIGGVGCGHGYQRMSSASKNDFAMHDDIIFHVKADHSSFIIPVNWTRSLHSLESWIFLRIKIPYLYAVLVLNLMPKAEIKYFGMPQLQSASWVPRVHGPRPESARRCRTLIRLSYWESCMTLTLVHPLCMRLHSSRLGNLRLFRDHHTSPIHFSYHYECTRLPRWLVLCIEGWWLNRYLGRCPA